VQVAPVEQTSYQQQHPLPGTVRAIARAQVAAKMQGSIEAADLTIGRQVSAGEVVLTIHAAELEAQVAQARVALDLAQRDYEREDELLQKGAATAATVRTLKDRCRMASAALAAAEAQLAYTQVRAPFDGVITGRHIEPGDFAALGTPLFAMQGRELEIEVPVPEFLPMSPGPGSLFLVVGEQRHPVNIREISPAVDPLTRTRLARVRPTGDLPLQSGQFVRVLWPAATTTALTVPTSAVQRLGQMERVFVVDMDHASLRLVKTGRADDGRTVILAGLNAGEHIILAPPATLRDGQPIHLAP
jgi:RND family efflux transporter MFP subunit